MAESPFSIEKDLVSEGLSSWISLMTQNKAPLKHFGDRKSD